MCRGGRVSTLKRDVPEGAPGGGICHDGATDLGDTGDRMTEPLVLLPGFMTDARIWGAQIEALSGERTLLLPTFGQVETVDDMADAVLACAPPRFALAGPGLGGMVAMAILARAPERVTRIALLATSCLAEPPQAAAARDQRIARVKAGRLAEAMRDEVPADALAEGPMRDAVADFLVEMAMGLGRDRYLRQSQAMLRRPDRQRILRQTRLPALVLGGAEDRIHLPRRHEFMAELMPRGELCIVDGAGHAPTLERPDAVTAALRVWLDRAPEPARRAP